MLTRVARLYGKQDLKVETQEFSEPGPGNVLLRMAVGGICGSDLHYYQDGGFGPIQVREPIISGHEASGYVDKLGDGVSELTIGALVAVNPSQPCGKCQYCDNGEPIHCLDMRFMGSAMRLPHEQGMFGIGWSFPQNNASLFQVTLRQQKQLVPNRWPFACMRSPKPEISLAKKYW